MISREEILKLASLCRLSLSEAEIEKMQKDMNSILAYVDKLKSAPVKIVGPVISSKINVLREDANAHGNGAYTAKLLAASPHHTEEFVKVKKILGSSQ